MGVKILSLFDGMACGMIAMQLAGVEVESYDAYEIDKYAIKTAQHNFPMIKEHGDVFEADFTQYEGVDFLVGGSPCTYWSIAQTKNRETVASGIGWELFSQYVRALHEAKPKYFIYENNKSMSKQIRASIDEAFGFEAVLINSALVSAQNRQRLYWVGKRNEDGTYSRVNVEQPADRGILLRDILETGVVWQEKSYNLTTRCCGGIPEDTLKRHRHTMVAEPVACRCRGRVDASGNGYAKYECREDGKSNTLDTNTTNGAMVAEPINTDANGKAFCVTSRYYKGFGNNPGKCLEKHRDSMVAEPISYCTGKNMEHLMRNFGSKGKIVDEESKTPTLMAAAGMGGGNHIYYADLIAEPVCVAERGRMYCGQPQHYEARTDGKTNTLTSVEKDNRVAEPINVTADGKAQCLRATCYKDGIRNIIANEVDKKTGVAEPINDICQVGAMPRPDGEISTSAGFRIYSTEAKGRYLYANGGGAGAKTGLYAVPYDCDVVITENSIRCQRRDQKHSTVQGSHVNFTDGKTQTLSPSHIPNVIERKDGKEITIYEVRDGKITIKGKQYPIKLKDGFYIIRKLTVSECKRLQTVPEWYEFPVSNSQAYKMLGNGWTCEVIAHLIRSCMAEQWGSVDA